MRILVISAFLGAAAAMGGPIRYSSGPNHVALVELYTSEGCSSCPPADQWLGALTQKPGLWKDFVPLEFHVNYWNGLGWKDRLSTPEFTAREYAYASAWGSRNVYTPCFVRNGAEWRTSWGEPGAMRDAPGTLSIEIDDNRVCHVAFRPAASAPAENGAYAAQVAILGSGLSSKVTAGENDGRTLRHEFVVLGIAATELSPDPSGAAGGSVSLPAPIVADSKRLAVAAWVVRRGDLTPVQATGGWLP